jgi:hypothetical protein
MDKARLAHHIPGRTRFRVPARQGDVTWFKGIVQAFGTRDGILTATARPETGSLLVTHTIGLPDIISFAGDRQLFTLASGEDASGEGISTMPPQLLAALAPLMTLSRWETVAISSLVGMAAWQALRGEIFGPAVSHAIQAADMLQRKLR